ncbi:type II toxin-antitoxin system RelE/ParE family toxin [Roseivirga pacifica]|uniref:type II toxin-antitoxin system RelE/ParE family toxin n=1 Tax=Roseivirga pacifica TaxID=1267423 RepID=UPI00227B2C54|nr:type II toxin-antitoxin system RelE/ParE family toxin [Roseivirga pacifica]|tara:strand:+ start:49 stop:408 length:360 start_codon:yes stop_codon:yes gene_type:complete
MAQIHLTDRTFLDIEDIYEYSVEKWGVKTAERYLDQIQDSLLLLQENPKLLLAKPEISNRFKLYQSGSHWLICDMIGSDIFILTIKHLSMNLLDRLGHLEPMLEEEAAFLYQKLSSKRD